MYWNCEEKLQFMPCSLTGTNKFCDGPNFLSKIKSLIVFSASSKIYSMKIIFWCGTKCLWPAQYMVIKFFSPDQKFIYILWQSQTFCDGLKDDLHSVKLFLWRHKRFWRGTKCSQIFELAQKIRTGPKHLKGQGIRKSHLCHKIHIGLQ